MTTSDNISAIEKALEGAELAKRECVFAAQEARKANGSDTYPSRVLYKASAVIDGLVSTLLAEARKVEALTGIGSAQDLIADWLGEGTDDLPDDTPARIEIGKRTIIADTLGSLRRARIADSAETGGSATLSKGNGCE